LARKPLDWILPDAIIELLILQRISDPPIQEAGLPGSFVLLLRRQEIDTVSYLENAITIEAPSPETDAIPTGPYLAALSSAAK
jgi:hypothetical protein